MLGGHQDNPGNTHYTGHAWECVPKTLISPERNKEENTVSRKKGNCCKVILEYSHRETGQHISTQLSTENGNFHSVNSLSRILNDCLLVRRKRSWGYLRNTAQEKHGPIIKSKLEVRHAMTWRRSELKGVLEIRHVVSFFLSSLSEWQRGRYILEVKKWQYWYQIFNIYMIIIYWMIVTYF